MTVRKFIQGVCGSVGAAAVVWLAWSAWGFGMLQLRQHDALLAVMRVVFTVACIVGGVVFAGLAFMGVYFLTSRLKR